MAGTIIVDKIQLDVGQDTLRVFSNTGSTILSANTLGINASTLAYGTLPSGRLPTIPTSNMPTGSVLKVEYFNPAGAGDISSTSTSFVNFSNVTFTPVSTTSNIFIFTNLQLRVEKTGADSRFRTRMLINDSSVFEFQEYGIYDYGLSGIWANLNWPQIYVHSNTTGGTVNIKYQAHCDGRATSITQYGSSSGQGRSSIQVMEVAV
jgi:hypothetical protein